MKSFVWIHVNGQDGLMISWILFCLKERRGTWGVVEPGCEIGVEWASHIIIFMYIFFIHWAIYC